MPAKSDNADIRHHPLNVSGEQRAFFGRRSGKRLHKGQDQLFREVLPALEIKLGEGEVDPQALFGGKAARVTLEIGYGGGEHLARQARQNPETGFIGCEVFSGGIAKLLQHIDEQALENVRVFTDDALKLLVKLPAASIDEAYLLYPDPWPKTRHWKRRFVSDENLRRLARVMKPGAPFRFASDIDSYVGWTLAHARRSPEFEWTAEAANDWREPWAGWPGTRYEAKAIREGRRGVYLTFRRL